MDSYSVCVHEWLICVVFGVLFRFGLYLHVWVLLEGRYNISGRAGGLSVFVGLMEGLGLPLSSWVSLVDAVFGGYGCLVAYSLGIWLL